MKPVYAAIDVDGVVLDLVSYVCDELQADQTQWTQWGFRESFPDDARNIARFEEIIKAAPDLFVSARPYHDAKAAILRLANAGVNYCFVSSFPRKFYLLRKWWLWYNLLWPEYDSELNLPRLRIADTIDKARMVYASGMTHLLEDKPETAAAAHQLGIKSYLVPRAYNGGLALEVPRCTIGEFADLLVAEHAESRA